MDLDQILNKKHGRMNEARKAYLAGQGSYEAYRTAIEDWQSFSDKVSRFHAPPGWITIEQLEPVTSDFDDSEIEFVDIGY